MEAALMALKEGRISFGEFHRETKRYWARMATRLHRSRTAMGVDASDIEQELLMVLPALVARWRSEDLDGCIAAYCAIHARTSAVRHLRRMRGQGQATARGCAWLAVPESMGPEPISEPIVFALDEWNAADRLARTTGEREVLAGLKATADFDQVAVATGLSRDTTMKYARRIASRRVA